MVLKIKDNEGNIIEIPSFKGENGKSPIVKNDTWWIYDDVIKDYVDTGIGATKESIVTKEAVEAVLTGTITSHNHDGVYLTDAPSDSKQYVRSNGEWASIDFSSADFATKEELNAKVDKVEGKGLSTNDYTTEEKSKLDGIEAGAQVNIIESVSVNGSALQPEAKNVNIDIASPIATAKSEAINASKVTVSESSGTDNVLKVYTITQNGSEIGKINVPKDLVVSGGSIVEVEGVKYLRLTIVNQTEPVDIAVTDLVDVYKGSTYITVSSDNTISVNFSALDSELVKETSEVGKVIKANEIAIQTASSEASTALSNHNTSENAHASLIIKLQENIDTVKNNAYSKTESDARYPLKDDTVKTLPESMLTLILKYVSGGSLNTMSDEDYNTILSYAPNEFNSYLINTSNLGITKYDIEVSSNNIVIYCKFIVSTIDYVYVFNIDRQTKEVNAATIVGSTDVGDGSYSINQSASNTIGGQSSFQMTLLTNGTGSKFLSDDGTYKEIDTSSLAAKSEVSQYLNMPDELLSAIFGTTGDTATDENYATIVKYVSAGENKVFLGNMISLGLSGSGKFAITNNDEEITIIIDYQDSVSNQSTKSMIGINHSTKAVTFSRIINSISVKDSGLTIYGNKRKADGTSLSKTIDLITNGTGSKYLSDDGSYKEIDTSNLATKDELAQVFVMSEALQAAIENVVDGDGSQFETLISLVPAGTRKMYLPRNGSDLGLFLYTQYVYIYRPNTDGSTDTMYLSFIGLMSFMYPSTYPLYNVCVKIDCTNKTKSESSGVFSISGNTVAITGVDENSNEYTFQIVHHKNVCKQFFMPVSVKTLTNLPVDEYSIAATVSAASTISFASTPRDGMEYVIDIKNTSSSDIIQSIPTDSNWQCDVDSVTLPAGKVTSISIRYVHSIYCVRV